MSIPTSPPLPALPTGNAPTPGAQITLPNGLTVRVHPECKLTRDRFVQWHQAVTLAIPVGLANARIISVEESIEQRRAYFTSFAAGHFDHGVKNNIDKRFTPDGIKQQLAIRIALAHEPTLDAPHASLIGEWVDAVGLDAAIAIMDQADANAPKSSIPAAGPPSVGISSGNTAG